MVVNVEWNCLNAMARGSSFLVLYSIVCRVSWVSLKKFLPTIVLGQMMQKSMVNGKMQDWNTDACHNTCDIWDDHRKSCRDTHGKWDAQCDDQRNTYGSWFERVSSH